MEDLYKNKQTNKFIALREIATIPFDLLSGNINYRSNRSSNLCGTRVEKSNADVDLLQDYKGSTLDINSTKVDGAMSSASKGASSNSSST